ncbi:PEP-CTERM sorting domain-containing protein [Nostoc edaphicum CCNP1411]|uniref:PEP-CTERM sorting domain-containing protein n=1 Tax=Nostoc edaphicum CCNP1411 TaxID=1472755 RepID=A0A7D7QF36_9NOSO|nr:PEP-CTERM sorting domain-containing protein [Nostoc edaphicum]QMS87682.1 PEP-CTERM sorting domain-containing protein [Nostoc edaphicum CCNP1411]
MTDSIFQKLAAATVRTALIFSLGEAIPAQAAALTYNFSNDDKTLIGTFSFDQAAAADDQEVTIAEGLKISATFGGQLYTEADDPLASVFTDFSGTILNEAGLGLYFTPGTFNVFRESFINLNDSTDAGVQTVTYTSTSVPEPSLMLGLSVFGLGLFLGKKTVSSKPSSTKA